MSIPDNHYIVPEFMSWKGVLQDSSKSRSALQPVFEAFTNALEAIKLKEASVNEFKGEISITINATETIEVGSVTFSSLTIKDNGVGFDENQFKRFNTFKDKSKGFKNLGSGRLQYVLNFDHCLVHSVFEENGEFFEREFTVSMKKSFLDKNAIVFHKYCRETNSTETGTSITFVTLQENSPIYNKLTADELKDQLLKKYVYYFCSNKANLPKVTIKYFIQSELKEEAEITSTDIPNVDKSDFVTLPYSRIKSNGKGIEKTTQTETFKIDAFRLSNISLESNELKLLSKGEVVEEVGVNLDNLAKHDSIKGHRYLFMVSGEYIDDKDSNERGALRIPSLDTFRKGGNLYSPQEVLIEDIQNGVNQQINKMYPEIEKVKDKRAKELERLKEMFLLNDDDLNELKITANDNEAKILEKFYELDAKKNARVDAAIKESIDNLNALDPKSRNYDQTLNEQAQELIKKIPIHNKYTLAHYIARRKLVLDLFQKVLDKEIDKLKNGGRIDEDLMHNLLFKQGSEKAESSDLWLVDEQFIYFKAFSERRLDQLEIDGKMVFKESFSEEEERHLKSLGENRVTRRPDILLFPQEGKCILIEFKAPDENVSDHLTQIDGYASLLRNYTNVEFQIMQFYGYIIGEGIEDRDVRGKVSRFEHSKHLDYWFRPSERVHFFDNSALDGNIYTEVIKYTTLLKRAKQRNSIFISKLGIDSKE